jgi:activator of HSP90 ATPase
MMNERNIRATVCNSITRRQVMAGAVVTFSGLAAGSTLLEEQARSTKEAPVASANRARTSLHEETDYKASPQRIYESLIESKQFAAFSGAPAEIDPKAGGAFSMFGGMIVGRNVELVSGQRVVQAWRPTHWDAGVYSIVKFELTSRGSETHVVLDHKGFPEGEFESLTKGWHEHYLEPLRKYLV